MISKRVSKGLAAVLLVCGCVALLACWARLGISTEQLGTRLHALGPAAPLAYLLLYVVAPFVLFPAVLLTAAAGLIWSWPLALLVSTLASNLSANLGFWSGRKLASRRGEGSPESRMHRMESRLADSGFTGIFVLRMLPVAPFQVVNVAAGASRVRWSAFFWGTLTASLPGRFCALYAIDAARTGSFLLWPALAGMLGLMVVPTYLVHRRKQDASVAA